MVSVNSIISVFVGCSLTRMAEEIYPLPCMSFQGCQEILCQPGLLNEEAILTKFVCRDSIIPIKMWPG